MKRVLRTLLIALILTVNIQLIASANVLNETSLQNEIVKSYTAALSKKIQGDIEVKVISLPTKSVEVPAGTLKFEVLDSSLYFSPRKIVRVNIYANNELVKSIAASVSISVMDDVWVAKDFVTFGNSLTNSELQRKDISLNCENVLRKNDNPSQMIARKVFKSGEIIDKRFVEETPAVLKNNPVSVRFQAESLDISIDAFSLENGKIGDFIKVKSKQYNKVYVGKVVSSNTVLVEI